MKALTYTHAQEQRSDACERKFNSLSLAQIEQWPTNNDYFHTEEA